MPIQIQVQPVTHYQQNCSILKCDETGDMTIIDPGGDIELILDICTELNGNIRYILLTHGHLDHAGQSRQLADKLKVSLIGPHKDDQFWLDKMEDQSNMFGFEMTTSFTPDQYLIDGEEIQLGNSCLKTIHCPGHTPGHVVFYLEREKSLIAGDVLFKGSIGRTDFPMSCHEDLIKAIKEKVFLLDDQTIVYPGHGPTTTIEIEKRTNPYVGIGS